MSKHKYYEVITHHIQCQHCQYVWSEYIQPHWSVICPNCNVKEKLEETEDKLVKGIQGQNND